MNINLIYIKLRKTQTAVLKLNDDGTYTILVNSDKPIDVQRKGILHEIGHILNDDMYSHAHIDLLERMAHARQFDDVEGINFYTHII
ncbi:MAG: ImmA/IrrE family metallo-endopeptidase [Veillonella sp.]|jgi:putative toxin-antitoxin system, toxin component|uniref:ImmA/IrrE family metallo-endopeptidase n=1 Tax=Veillonella sp. TaxID=1926307 RepID=UPI00204DB8E1|nr:ImmA/IrrE family metallo-endopeptidase [Veillonella sp.]DAM63618.1 MAG TPA: IrrE N-terminal-like domain [Caudoviricetes sp.]MDU2701344.1 ImmA/IrrE family metallo-endopeptidase [Veillonella sp.]MDU7145733.1 ImmA/IrrE family metallo-endopeptidase [Veillonella sp.]MDU7211802.1 ImmA/IrrE family metallo-endopeptidase [Veillonella sp.]DAQ82140.1 MAG TPA: IrrE N-terminal-like domain [Caudoviricetes sp.]